jgi:hypothetical protein
MSPDPLHGTRTMHASFNRNTNRTRRLHRWAVAALFACATPAVLAADNDEIEKARSEFSRLFNVEQLMNRAADNISARYNLNAWQRQQTREMLIRETTEFLNEHEDIWPVVRDLARLQQQGVEPQGKIGQQLSAKVLPLLQEIEETIYEANERWRDILTEDQKRMHDHDLADMAKTFAKMDDNYRRMSEGQPGQPKIFPDRNDQAGAPKQPPKPVPSYKAAPIDPIKRVTPTEDAWDRYVEDFIRDFRLDDSQSDSAYSILKECKRRARDYRNGKRSEFAQVQDRIKDANRGNQSPNVRTAKLRVWKQIERKLTQPIHDLFLELQTRLERIPTDAQRARARKLGRKTKAPSAEVKKSAPKPRMQPAAAEEKPGSTSPDGKTSKPQKKATTPTTAPPADNDSSAPPE